jgi:hypothetical protein
MAAPFCECRVRRTANGLICSNCGNEIAEFTERAAIIEFDGNVSRAEAERLALAQLFGEVR